MSHLDPYGAAERGWDRPEQPGALPWPERDIEPGPATRRPGAGPELYAEPYARPDRYAEPPYERRGSRYDDRPAREPGRAGEHPRSGPGQPWPGHRPEPPYRDDPADRDDPAYRDEPVERAGRGGVPWPDEQRPGHLGRQPDDEYPTAQFAPVPGEPPIPAEPPLSGAPSTPGDPTTADAEPEQPSGRRQRGRRRASADRPATQQAVPSRAGRNLPAAIAVGVGLGAAIVVPLFLYPPAFLAVVVVAVAVGTWEMARAVRRSGAHPPLVPLIAGGVLTVGLAWWAGPDALSLGLLVTVLGTMIWRLGDGPAGFQRDLTAATLIAVYVPFLAGFAAMLAAAPDDGPWRVLVTLVAVVLSDTGGYAAGVTFGKHPMAPSISPKKSWEGFAGSVTAAAVGSAVLIWQLFDVAPWWGAVFGVAVSGAAVLGDLAESMIKRDLGVKDMSNLLPGHGGLMDRLDSVLFAVPTAYLLLAVFVPVVG
ncbi:phosphatidate cytidylyltransferase [Micromonospora siamensis]|uniref:Phosphatidate cytidylyltransferase n=1 Tax=Micromonospora siamensis TaxID=299152 RepID=A0A1C5HNP3_9ACTN|nr:phosphatidate cytidylyltransferase [Micromonospora siamensis]SCG47533.1 phosphatidate cytidylyltransferase [Micromonospora siamensis]